MSAKNWLIFILLSIVWGSSFILIKKSLIAFSPVQVACLRITISMLAFLPILIITKRWLPNNKLKYAALAGITGSGIPAFMYAIAETRIESAIAGILNSMAPIFTLIVGLLFFGTVLIKRQVLGVIIGLLGALVFVFLDAKEMEFNINYYAFFIIIGTICYGFSSNIVKKYCQDMDAITLTGVSFLSIGWITIIWLFNTDFIEVMQTDDNAWFSLAAAATLSLFGTVMANVLFFKLIQETDAVFGSSIAYVIPITALFWGFYDGEHLVLTHLGGMGLILLGIYIMRKKRL